MINSTGMAERVRVGSGGPGDGLGLARQQVVSVFDGDL